LISSSGDWRLHRLIDEAGDRNRPFARDLAAQVRIDNKPGDFEYVKIET
jgi:hypothetical protein